MTFEMAIGFGLFILAGVALGVYAILSQMRKHRQEMLDLLDMKPRHIAVPEIIKKAGPISTSAQAHTKPAAGASQETTAPELPLLSPADPPLTVASGLIYVCAPASGILVSGALSSSFLGYMAKLQHQFQDLTIVAPAIQDHVLKPHLAELGEIHAASLRCETMLRACDEVWLIEYWGFRECDSVSAELALAKKLGKTIRHFSPGSVIHLEQAT